MATNSLSGVNLAQISREAIDYLGSQFFPVNLFTSNFSKDIATKGESVTTRIVSGFTSQDVSGGYSTNAQNAVTTAVTTSLSNFKGVPIEIKDAEVSKAGNRDWLMKNFYRPLAEATIKSLVDDLLALVTNANYSNKTTQAVGGFDADVLADIGGALTTRKVATDRRAMLLSPTYHAALAKDSALHDISSSRDPAVIIDNRVKRARGFDVFEYDAIPGNSENLVGFGCGRSALVIAARPVYQPEMPSVKIEQMTEPNTGLPFQFRLWYSTDNGCWYLSGGFLYGVSVGQSAALQRIVSA